jgi:predicted anti-sigma-YlaC factor YlaD
MTNAIDGREMDCACARECISACCDGEAERTPALASHLGECAECRSFEAGCGELSKAFGPRRDEAVPDGLRVRVLGPRPRIHRVGGSRWLRVAAGLTGLLSIGGVCAGLSARPGIARSEVDSGWLEPLAGRALHPMDARLRSWSETMGRVVREGNK